MGVSVRFVFRPDPVMVLRAERKFERRKQGPRPSVDFRRYCTLFSEPRTMTEIGAAVKLSRQEVSLIYRRYFQPVFPVRDGWQRLKAVKAAKRRPRQPAPIVLRDGVRKVASVLREKGFKVEPIKLAVPGPGQALSVDGMKCSVSVITNCARIGHTPRSQSYFQVKLSANTFRKCRWLIIRFRRNDRWDALVLPCRLVLRTCRGKQKRIYIPEDFYLKHRRFRQRINLTKYLSAWHLLR